MKLVDRILAILHLRRRRRERIELSTETRQALREFATKHSEILANPEDLPEPAKAVAEFINDMVRER